MKFFDHKNIPIYAVKVSEKKVPIIEGRTDGKFIDQGECLVDGLKCSYRINLSNTTRNIYLFYVNAWYRFQSKLVLNNTYYYDFQHDNKAPQQLFTRPRKSSELEMV